MQWVFHWWVNRKWLVSDLWVTRLIVASGHQACDLVRLSYHPQQHGFSTEVDTFLLLFEALVWDFGCSATTPFPLHPSLRLELPCIIPFQLFTLNSISMRTGAKTGSSNSGNLIFLSKVQAYFRMTRNVGKDELSFTG